MNGYENLPLMKSVHKREGLEIQNFELFVLNRNKFPVHL